MGGYNNVIEEAVKNESQDAIQEIHIHMKTPDCLDYALENIQNEDQKITIKAALAKWFQYNECVDLVYNVQNDTLEVSRR